MSVDAVVVGTGILGLLLAKRLLDLGQTVVVVEKSANLAHGASSKNHGWIHQGTTHALSADSASHGWEIARRVQYGYSFFKSYAAECFDEPFLKSYAVTNSAARAAFARERWAQCEVPFQEMTPAEFIRIEPNIRTDAASYFFEVADGRLNNRMLFMKLYAEIKRKGAVLLTEATYEYLNRHQIQVTSPRGKLDVTATVFLYATGAGLDDSYKKLAGQSLHMRYYKSHMIFVPRLTNVSVIGLDEGSPIVVNHGDISAVNVAHDEVRTTGDDYEVNPTEIRRALHMLDELYTSARNISPNDICSVACLKPYAPVNPGIEGLRIDSSIFRFQDDHVFALPGKMTAAPYVADVIIKTIFPMLNLNPIMPRPFDIPAPAPQPPVRLRGLPQKAPALFTTRRERQVLQT